MSGEKPVDWKAEWIWQGDDPAPYHFFLYFRKTFDLARAPCTALLHVTASDRYRLFVNGRFIGRGPERCDPRYQSYDTYDLATKLVPGGNCIAVQAYFYGCNTGFTRDGRAGFLAQLEIEEEDGGLHTIGTDREWKAMPAKGWRRDAKPVGIGVGVTEVFDARLDPPDWAEPGFDDSGWERAALVPINTGQWCGRPVPRRIPFLAEKDARPAALLRAGEVLELDDTLTTIDVAEMAGREVHEKARRARVEGFAALVAAGGAAGLGCPAAVAATSPHALGDDVFDGIRDPFVLLDFGKEINAFPRITVEGAAGSIVDISWGEQLISGRLPTYICATRAADRYILRDGLQTFQSFEYKTFRYLQLTFRTGASPLRVHSVGARTWSYPAAVRGDFSCSDDTLSRLWKATVATTDLCTDDAFMDTPFREKRNWLGDGSHVLLGVFAAWGDVAVVRRYFELVLQGPMGDGMLRMFYPGSDFVDPKTKIVSTIPQHALVWAARVWEYYRYFGNTAFLEGAYPTVRALDGWCDRHANSDGLLDRLPYGCWLDWTPADIRGAGFGTNAFRLHMLDDLSAIASVLGKSEEALAWADKARALRAALRELFWDDERGAFLDSIYRGRLTGVASELGNALSLLFDVADPGQGARVAALLQRTDSGLAPATPLFFHYIPQALFHDGRAEEAVTLIRDRFWRMMEVSQTIWEGWSRHAMLPQITEMSSGIPDVVPGGRLDGVIKGYRPGAISLAHCGGLGSGFLLLTEVLGIKPKGAGFDGCILKPQVRLLEKAGGTFPSPRGDLSLSWGRERGKTRVSVRLPAGLDAELLLPSGKTARLGGGTHEVDAE